MREREVVLRGGVSTAGVVRVGATVRRPAGPHTPAVHRLLRHLEAVGFDGAPRVLGVDDRGREVLDFVPGEVGCPPLPAWVADPGLLASVARLQRRLHTATASFAPEPGPADTGGAWAGPLAAFGGDRWCHLDVCVENVVVRGGRAVAFIDYDLAGPADPTLDVAVAARHWVPLRDPADLDPARAHLSAPDLVDRFHAYCRAYRAPDPARVVAAALAFLDHALGSVGDLAAAGHPGFAALWAGGYEAANRRARTWIAGHATALAAVGA